MFVLEKSSDDILGIIGLINYWWLIKFGKLGVELNGWWEDIIVSDALKVGLVGIRGCDV